MKKPEARGRSEGWQHAKISGHKFESDFAAQILKDHDLFNSLSFVAKLDRIDRPISACITSEDKKPKSIFGDFTIAKTDVTVTTKTGRYLDLSIKKPSTNSGQIFLCRLARFLDLIKIKTKKDIPKEVEWTLRSFFGETNGLKITEFAPKAQFLGPKIKKHKLLAEIYQNRLYASTIKLSYPDQWMSTQTFFKQNIDIITDCCFRSGMNDDIKEPRTTADYIYIGSIRRFVAVEALIDKSSGWNIFPGDKGYYKGSTIKMPWGFLQVHRPGEDHGPYQVQFHWNVKDMIRILDSVTTG